MLGFYVYSCFYSCFFEKARISWSLGRRVWNYSTHSEGLRYSISGINLTKPSKVQWKGETTGKLSHKQKIDTYLQINAHSMQMNNTHNNTFAFILESTAFYTSEGDSDSGYECVCLKNSQLLASKTHLVVLIIH